MNSMQMLIRKDPFVKQNVKNIQTSLLSYVIHGNCTEELYCLYVRIAKA